MYLFYPSNLVLCTVRFVRFFRTGQVLELQNLNLRGFWKMTRKTWPLRFRSGQVRLKTWPDTNPSYGWLVFIPTRISVARDGGRRHHRRVWSPRRGGSWLRPRGPQQRAHIRNYFAWLVRPRHFMVFRLLGDCAWWAVLVSFVDRLGVGRSLRQAAG